MGDAVHLPPVMQVVMQLLNRIIQQLLNQIILLVSLVLDA